MSNSPAAVILPSANDSNLAALEDALAQQTHLPGEIVWIAARERLGAGLTLARQTDPHWVWLLDGGVLPEPTALESLLRALEQIGDPDGPILLASKVLVASGRLDPTSAPVPDVHRPARVWRALEHHSVSLRAARLGSFLVSLPALESLGLASARSARERDLEWTSRLLKDRLGVLVPASVVVRSGPGRAAGGRPIARMASGLRLLAELDPEERLWFGAHLAAQARTSGRQRRGIRAQASPRASGPDARAARP